MTPLQRIKGYREITRLIILDNFFICKNFCNEIRNVLYLISIF